MEGQNQSQKQSPSQKIQTSRNQPQQQVNVNNHSPSSSRSRSYSQSNSSRSGSNNSSKSQKSQKSVQKQEKQGMQGIEKKQNNQAHPEKKIRYKYCCKVCKHTDSSKKACVCVVPKGQRRTQIGQKGCQTCGCNGCSKQDFISRGQDPQYKPGQKSKFRKKDTMQFQARNGCCRKCMKAFSKSNKSCLCQVPQDVRNTKLPSSGCKICGCFGCNPQDKKDPKNKKSGRNSSLGNSRKQKQRSRSRDKKRRQHRQKSQQSYSREYIDPVTMNFFNVQKSILGMMMVNQYRIDPALLGFGIPQRTYSYLKGKPK